MDMLAHNADTRMELIRADFSLVEEERCREQWSIDSPQ